jgi:uncharacterized protein (TIGR02246 family)
MRAARIARSGSLAREWDVVEDTTGRRALSTELPVGGLSDDERVSDEQLIRDLIERWARAVHDGDLATVVADHADDIVMFDVPPPEEGVRGIEDYRGVWPAFFEWQAGGAVFEITELDVTAGTDVAWATALLRCGTAEELAEIPERRLRLSLGLRKEDGRWVVAHEHHSFTDRS